jgi:hypothetical protein
MFLRANLGNILIAIVAAIVYFFLKDIKSLPLLLILILGYIDITIFNISFEYQRITLVIARLAKAHKSTNLSVPQLQVLMTSDKISPLLLIDAVISGIITGYFLLTSIWYLIAFFVMKYLLGIFLPSYKPYKYLFKLVGQELNNNSMSQPHEFIEKTLLLTYYKMLPHNKNYETEILYTKEQ